MEETVEKKERVITAGIHTGRQDPSADTTAESMHELKELVKTAGGEVVCEVIQNKSKVDSALFLGEGKLEEIRNSAETLHADTIVFDDELSPVQLRNIADFLRIKVLDRTMLILDIFALRAKTSEGKLQVELAQLKYELPRLRGMGGMLSREGGGIGTRGPGETRLETDRRHIMRRISALESQLKELRNHRELIRTRRKKDNIITAALVGYTNAGKSTLLNLMTDAGVYVEDKLFATLDPTSRKIILDDNREILLVDTVGFIRKLPHNLIEAFKSTLEEAAVADLLIYVVDITDEEYREKMLVVESVLREIGVTDKPVVCVYNKCDLPAHLPVTDKKYRANVFMSAKTGAGKDDLLHAVSETAPGKKRKANMVIPYSDASALSELHTSQKVLSEEYTAEGIRITALVDAAMYERIKRYAEQ